MSSWVSLCLKKATTRSALSQLCVTTRTVSSCRTVATSTYGILPGGRVQLNELPDAAVVREVKEETGLDVEVVRLTGVYGRADGRADIVFTFECRVVSGEPGPTEEADFHEWFHVDNLPVNTIPKQVARIRDVLLREPQPIFRTLTEPSGRRWLDILADRNTD